MHAFYTYAAFTITARNMKTKQVTLRRIEKKKQAMHPASSERGIFFLLPSPSHQQLYVELLGEEPLSSDLCQRLVQDHVPRRLDHLVRQGERQHGVGRVSRVRQTD